MNADFLGRGNDGFGVGLDLEAGDVLRHRAAQQLHVLRQIADVAAECVRRPLIERGAIEAHAAARGVPDPDQKPHQR